MRLASRKARRSASALPPPPRRVPQLHDEIASFSEALRETAHEESLRDLTVARLNAVLQRVHPGAATQLFGSAHTDLRLPDGDIDVLVQAAGVDDTTLLRQLGRELRRSGVASGTLELPHAKVPIVKWRDGATRIAVDACFNNPTALDTSDLLAASTRRLPGLRPLVLVLKAQLISLRLNETHRGGLE